MGYLKSLLIFLSMKDILQLFRRFVPPYKGRLIKNVLYNLLHSIFGASSFLMMMPILSILFGTKEDVLTKVEWEMSSGSFMHNLSYYITSVKLEHGAAASLLCIGLFMIIAVIFKTGFSYLAAYEMIYIRNGVVRDLRAQLYDKILRLPLPFFSDERKGDILSRITGDVKEVESSVMNSLNMLFKNPIIIIVYLTIMIIISWQLTIFVFVLLPIAGYIIGRIGKSLKKKSREGQNKMGEILSNIEETLSGLRIIKAFNAEDKMNNSFNKEINIYRRIMNKLMRRKELAHPMSELLGTIVIIIVLWYGGALILSNNSSLAPEKFLAYLGLFYSIITPAKQFSNALYNVQKGMASMDRIDKILLTEPSIKDKENAIDIKEFSDKVEYRDVQFAYNGSKNVLKKVSLDINKGKIIALVGQSGSGKTTFADLLPRFYDVNNGGGIFIDGHNIKDLSMKSLRSLMGNVNQDPILFNDTIYNNIAFGLDNANEEDVINAAKIANAHKFIMESDNGYQTNIGDRGGKLSGGQRQRLSIARAILKNPPILILDEATSALDTESERLVQDALYKLMENRTSIVVAHRLSTIKNADLICVFHEGEIIERGSHEELVALGGTYFKLQEMQSF
jgi:subfamily B ATP-binding cassette protein MsbA